MALKDPFERKPFYDAMNGNEGPAETMLWEKIMSSNVALYKMDGMLWSGFSAEFGAEAHGTAQLKIYLLS